MIALEVIASYSLVFVAQASFRGFSELNVSTSILTT